MKKHLIIGLISFLIGLIIFGTGTQRLRANFMADNQAVLFPALDQLAAPTPLPTAAPIYISGYPTPETRVLPPVGGNAGLVIAASVLVLIIIGGVLSARFRSKH